MPVATSCRLSCYDFVFAVIRVTLFVQNLLVCLSALVILAILFRKPGHPAVLQACEAAIIILGSASNLASQASTIAIERDWVVVVATGDKDFLAGMLRYHPYSFEAIVVIQTF